MTPSAPGTLQPAVLAKRFDLLAANAIEYALFLTDPQGLLQCWNKGAERLFGYRIDEVIGQHCSKFFPPDDVISGQPEHEMKEAADKGVCDSLRWLVRKDGSRFWCKIHTTALYNEVKQLHAYARVMHDLTERQESEAETKRADGLAETNRGKEEFMALLSHELRNPLSPILSSLGILKQMRTNDPVIQQASGIIERQVKQMVRLVDDLLDISRITKGKLRLTLQRVDFRAAMNLAADSARPLMAARHHEFSFLLPTETLWIEGDPTRLEQIAINLLTNAAKFTDTGGFIQMIVAKEGDDAVVRITDNGVGIPADSLPKIFELFTQVDGSLSRSHGGLGIGLALVRTLVEMQGGRVTAASGGLGKGSVFAVKFPLIKTETPPVEAGPMIAPPAHDGKQMRILIVEDNVDAADSLSMLLRIHGHEVRVAQTGPTALKLAAAFHPALVLLDIGLPGMNGWEVAQKLRSNPELKGMTLCALTGYTPSEADRNRPQQSGFDRHFVKPLSIDVLLDLIKTLA